MAIVTLDEAKAHLRIDGDAEDADLALKLVAAEEAVALRLDRSVPWQDSTGAEVPVPASVKTAALLILGDLYAVREASIVGATRTDNPTVERLLAPFRKWTFA